MAKRKGIKINTFEKPIPCKKSTGFIIGEIEIGGRVGQLIHFPEWSDYTKKFLTQLSKIIYDLDEFLEKYDPTPEEAMIEYQLCVDRIRDIVETEMQLFRTENFRNLWSE